LPNPLTYDKKESVTQEIGFEGREQQYRYNAQGHLIAHIEGLHETEEAHTSHTTEFKRDALGRLLEKCCPDGDISEFTYNSNGQLTQARNANRDVRFEYTAAGKLAKILQ